MFFSICYFKFLYLIGQLYESINKWALKGIFIRERGLLERESEITNEKVLFHSESLHVSTFYNILSQRILNMCWVCFDSPKFSWALTHGKVTIG